MISFNDIKLEHKRSADEILCGANELGCSYCFGTLYSWRKFYYKKIAVISGCLTAMLRSSTYGTMYTFPAGGNVKSAVEELADFADERGERLSLVCVSEENRKKLEELFPWKFEFSSIREDSEYIYLTKDLAELKGKKYHAKKNHVNHFVREFPDWSIEEISPDNIAECRALDAEWFEENLEYKEDATLDGEIEALNECFDHFEELGLCGLLLKVSGRPVAFTVGELMPCGNCVDVRFEKALSFAEGAYAVINMEFAKYITEHYPDAVYLNREEDLGLEGLRQAKESYKPVMLYTNYLAVLKEKI